MFPADSRSQTWIAARHFLSVRLDAVFIQTPSYSIRSLENARTFTLKPAHPASLIDQTRLGQIGQHEMGTIGPPNHPYMKSVAHESRQGELFLKLNVDNQNPRSREARCGIGT
jgi:hypothetical protein